MATVRDESDNLLAKYEDTKDQIVEQLRRIQENKEIIDQSQAKVERIKKMENDNPEQYKRIIKENKDLINSEDQEEARRVRDEYYEQYPEMDFSYTKEEKEAKNEIKDAKERIAKLEKDFLQDVKKFEKTCNKLTIGQKVFVAACTFAGALLGAVVGYVAGAVIGGLVGGTVGSVIPGLGTLVGAAVGGNVAGVVAAAKGLGIGTAIGAGIAMTIIAALTGYGASRGVKGEKPIFGTERQQHLFAMTQGMKADIHKQTHPTSPTHGKKAK